MRKNRQNFIAIKKSCLTKLIRLMATLSLAMGIACVSAGKKAELQTGPVKETRIGLASYYGKRLHGRETASGETFNKNEMVAAHPKYPMGTKVRVTNLKNHQTVGVWIIDRGPTHVMRKKGVIIDLSEEAARKLGIIKDGRALVRVEVLEWGADSRK